MASARPQASHRNRMSAGRAREFDDVHVAERIRSVAMKRPAILGAEHASRHAADLVARNIDQRRQRHAEAETMLLSDRPRALETDEAIVGDERPATRCEMGRQAFEEGIEQPAAVAAARAPGW